MRHFHISADTTSTRVGFSTYNLLAHIALRSSETSLGGNNEANSNSGRTTLCSPRAFFAQVFIKLHRVAPSATLCEIRAAIDIPPHVNVLT
ncbi:hypothetical protein ACHQM5_011361 [Ranunculus cassubicifolius]